MESVPAFGAKGLSAAIPLVAAILFGSLVVVTELNAVAICLSLLACIFIMLDFRLGVVCLIVLLPLSASAMFPHSIGGVTGLNPLNLLLVGTLAAWALHRPIDGEPRASFQFKPLIWLYVVPFLLAGIAGSQHLGDVSPRIAALLPMDFGGMQSYLITLVIKPLFIVLFALLIAAAASRSRQPELFIIPMLVSICAMCLITIIFSITSGVSLAELSSSGARSFFSPLGLHANDLGRLFAIAYALMLFTFAATKDVGLRLALIASMALVVIALTLTFSRGAFLGFAIVNILFLLSRRTPATFLLAGVAMAALTLLLPAEVFERITSGWGNGLNAISSGRVDEIWLPLLPELMRSPIFGNGLGAIAWSDAMRNGNIQAVGHAHNAYLSAALDFGLLGLGLLCAYFLHVWRGFRRLSSDPSLPPILRGFYAGAATGLVSFLLAGFFGSSLTPSIEQVFLWLAIGMMYGQNRATKAAEAC